MVPSVPSIVASNSSGLCKMLPARKNTKTTEDSNNIYVIYSIYLAKSLNHKPYTSTKILQCGKSKPIQMHIGKGKLYSLLMIEGEVTT